MNFRPHRSLPAWELLGSQPFATAGLDATQRDQIIISAQSGDDGTEHVLSRYGDAIWDLRPYMEQPGLSEDQKFIRWPQDCPPAMVADCKAVLYAWAKSGRPGKAPPHWVTVKGVAIASCIPLMRWLQRLGLQHFDQVQQLHINNYQYHCKAERRLSPWGVFSRLQFLDLLWAFKSEALYPLTANPWRTSSLVAVAGIVGTVFDRETSAGGVSKTPIIPRDVQAAIFRYCEAVIQNAAAAFDSRDRCDCKPWDSELLAIRNAAMYLVSITTGMRNDEVLGLENDACRMETVKGVAYRWVRSIEHKTKKGSVEYLCPELTFDALAILQRFAGPLQQKLELEIQVLQAAASTVEHRARLAKARADRHRLFLGVVQKKHNRVQVLTNASCVGMFERLAQSAGTDWKLAPHQTRRTYARMFVESRMGRVALIFLKEQFKHSSMSMTQLYASNPQQDRALFDEILVEMTAFKGELLESWTGVAPLSGGAGRKMIELRATPHADRKDLLVSAAEHIHIRATGHGWCLAQDEGCGGAGIYEATRCVDCKNAVIDENFSDTWLGIHEQQRELLTLDDVGAAVHSRAKREVTLAAKVLADLGIKETP